MCLLIISKRVPSLSDQLSNSWHYLFLFYASGGRISTVTDVGPGAVGERRVADLREVAEWPLLALDPRRDPVNI